MTIGDYLLNKRIRRAYPGNEPTLRITGYDPKGVFLMTEEGQRQAVSYRVLFQMYEFVEDHPSDIRPSQTQPSCTENEYDERVKRLAGRLNVSPDKLSKHCNYLSDKYVDLSIGNILEYFEELTQD